MASYVKNNTVYICEETHESRYGRLVESLQVNIKGIQNNTDIMVGVFYRSPS